MNERLPQLLAARLRTPLPGPMLGSRFEPTPRVGRPYDDPPPDARPAAVLALLYPRGGRWHLPLTLRPPDLANHAGQISLPGGAMERGETSQQAALREFHEELGAEGHPINIIGRLSPIYVDASNYTIDPWLGVSARQPDLIPDPTEVAEILEVPLDHLLDSANFGCYQRRLGASVINVPCFHWQTHRIWGATCMILGELVTVLKELEAGGRALS